MLRLKLARLVASNKERDLIDRILANQSDGYDSDVVIIVHSRFLSAFTIAKKRRAITQLLQVIAVVIERCEAAGLSCLLVTKEQLDQTVRDKVVFSHHTINAQYSADFREMNDLYHFKSGDLPDTLSIDPNGFAGWASIADKTVAELIPTPVERKVTADYFEMSSLQTKANQVSKYEQPDRVPNQKLTEPYVFVALQTVNDMVQRNAYLDIFSMLELIVEAFAGSKFQVVLKRHPKCRNKKMANAIREAVALHENVVETNASIHKLLEGAKAVYTVNSGVGSEAMIYELPIYCFGKSDYGPIANVIKTPDQARTEILNIKDRVSTGELHQFYYFYRTQYQVAGLEKLNDRIEEILCLYSNDEAH